MDTNMLEQLKNRRSCRVRLFAYSKLSRKENQRRKGTLYKTKHKVRLTVIDKKLYPEPQKEFCLDKSSKITS